LVTNKIGKAKTMVVEKNYGRFRRLALGAAIMAFFMSMYPAHLNDQVDEGIHKYNRTTGTVSSLKYADDD
jgi:hypothetical protein